MAAAYTAAETAKLRELYIKAKVGEARARRAAEAQRAKEAAVKAALGAIDGARVAAACDGGMEGVSSLIIETLGAPAWDQALAMIPDEWEEEEALAALRELLRAPQTAEHLEWLVVTA